MKNATRAQIAQIKSLNPWNLENLKNRKKVGSIPAPEFATIMRKKTVRSMNKKTDNPSTLTGKIFPLMAASLAAKGTPYFKVLIEGKTGIYYASPVFGHDDYNKARIFDKNEKTLKLMRLFNAIVTR